MVMVAEFKSFHLKQRLAHESVGWLHGMAAGLLSISFLMWSLPPFFLSKAKSSHLWIQGLSLFGAALGSATALAVGYKLKQIEPLLQVENQQEQEDALHQLAVSRYYAETLREAQVEAALAAETRRLPESVTVSETQHFPAEFPGQFSGFQPVVQSVAQPTVQSTVQTPTQPQHQPTPKTTRRPGALPKITAPVEKSIEEFVEKFAAKQAAQFDQESAWEPIQEPAQEEQVQQPVQEPDPEPMQQPIQEFTVRPISITEPPLGLRLSDPPAPKPPAMPDENDERVQEVWDKLNGPGCEWLMQLLLTKPLLIWGEQCSGKTSFASFLALLRIIFFGHQISVSDPHAHQNNWPIPFEVYGSEYNYNAINSRLVAYYQRLKGGSLAHTSIWDEVTQYQENCDPSLSGRFLKSILSDVRKPPEFPILLSHGNTLSALGGGKGGIKTMQARGLVEVNLRAMRDRMGNLKPALRGHVRGLDLNEKGEPTQQPIALEVWMQPKYLLQLFPELLQGGFTSEPSSETAGGDSYPVAV